MLLQEPRRAPRARDVSGSDTESLHSDVRDGVSEGDGEVEHTEETPAPPPVSLNLRRLDIAEGLRSLDEVDLEEIFERRAVLRTVPKFLQGSFRSALRVAFEEEATGKASGDEVSRTRVWKLFLLLRACSSTDLHEEVWSLGRSWRNALQPSQWEENCSAPVAKQTCKPVPKRCEDAGGNSLTIC